MGRTPFCDADAGVKKGPWTPEEDKMLTDYIDEHDRGSWQNLPNLAGLNRCGKSCRLRWTNYLRPDIKRGKFSEEEKRLIIHLHSVMGNKWSQIAARLPRRTDNEIKNYWNTHLRKRLLMNGIDHVTHQPRSTDLDILAGLPNLIAAANSSNFATNTFINNALQLQKLQLLQAIFQVMSLQNLNPPAAPSSFDSGLIRNDLAAILNYSSSSVMTTPANSTPSLVAASPETCTGVNQWQEVPVNLTSASSSPPTSSLEGWGGPTMDDLASDDDLGWKDILEQISWPDEL